jgi:hypothetical protein
MPVSWQAFWTPSDKPGGFGDYGAAGNNFGRNTEFRCGDRQRCVLLRNDPLYNDFARDRHTDAVRSTMRAMFIVQSQKSEMIP